jgi:hypothetical protein
MDDASRVNLESINGSKFQPLTEEESVMMTGGGVTVSVTLSLVGPDVGVDYSFELQ